MTTALLAPPHLRGQLSTADSHSACATAIRRAASPGYRRWLDHVSSVHGCERPIRLAGHLHTINPTTGEVSSSRSTESLPDGVIYVPCGDRRATVCPACAETYRADTYHLIRTGLVGSKGVPDTVATHPVIFATLTAPTFGPVHTRVVDPKTDKVKPCRMRRSIERCPHGRVMACPHHHTEQSPCLGQPLCPQCYDYTGHAVWNAWASELWRRTTITTNRALAKLGKTHGIKLRLAFAKVAEYQARGLIHFHALLRLDALDPHHPDTLLPPPAGITAADLDQALTHAVATKATEVTGHTSKRLTAETIGLYTNKATHTGRLIRTCWTLSQRPDNAHPEQWKTTYGRLRRWAHMLGFGGQFTTKSRCYSTTRKALKAARRHWQRTRQHAKQFGTDVANCAEETTLIVGALSFAGIGYRRTGDQWLALTAAA
ncbi:MAG: plasmid replication initiator protein, partial [Actinomycetota bacterium]|nr:plasmid replication initiator protein [Actinomycetota bacterium]